MVELGDWVVKEYYSWGLTLLDVIVLCVDGVCSRVRSKVTYTR